jgi:hypothetical protein
MTKTFFAIFFIGILAVAPASAASSPLKSRASAQIGYDNNASLSSTHRGDLFAQENVNVAYKHKMANGWSLRFNGGVLNSNYFEQTDQNILIPGVGAELGYLWNKRTMLTASYDLEYVDFVNNESVTTLNQDLHFGLKRKLNNKLVASVGTGVLFKDYQDRNARLETGLSSSKEREDERFVLDTDLSYKPNKNLLLKAGAAYYANDSNDRLTDYYDYSSVKIYIAATQKFNTRLSGSLRFSVENRDYDVRPIVRASGTEKDEIYATSGSLNYELREDLYLTAGLVYRTKVSNEPTQEYTGLLSSLGLRYSF